MSKHGLLLIAHGSKDPEWTAPFKAIERFTVEEFDNPTVLTYLESAAPAVPEGVERLIEQSVTHITIAPLFFATGSHVRTDIPGLIQTAAQRHPRVQFELLPAVGLLPSVQHLISNEIVNQASRKIIPRLEQVDESISVAGQLSVDHISLAANLGYKSIICNRPDEEEGDQQTPHDTIAKECARLGLLFHYLPVSPSDHTEQQARDMRACVNAAPKPALIYCRSGRRSKKLLAHSDALLDLYHPESFA